MVKVCLFIENFNCIKKGKKLIKLKRFATGNTILSYSNFQPDKIVTGSRFIAINELLHGHYRHNNPSSKGYYVFLINFKHIRMHTLINMIYRKYMIRNVLTLIHYAIIMAKYICNNYDKPCIYHVRNIHPNMVYHAIAYKVIC